MAKTNEWHSSTLPLIRDDFVQKMWCLASQNAYKNKHWQSFWTRSVNCDVNKLIAVIPDEQRWALIYWQKYQSSGFRLPVIIDKGRFSRNR